MRARRRRQNGAAPGVRPGAPGVPAAVAGTRRVPVRHRPGRRHASGLPAAADQPERHGHAFEARVPRVPGAVHACVTLPHAHGVAGEPRALEPPHRAAGAPVALWSMPAVSPRPVHAPSDSICS